jgi:hypothetical protein
LVVVVVVVVDVGPRTGVETGTDGLRTGAVGVRTGARTGAVGARTGDATVTGLLLPFNAAVLTSTFGEFCTSLTTPIDPSATNACFTSAGVIKGLRCRYSATTPVTMGVAMLVPDIVLVAVLLPDHALVIEVPGLK